MAATRILKLACVPNGIRDVSIHCNNRINVLPENYAAMQTVEHHKLESGYEWDSRTVYCPCCGGIMILVGEIKGTVGKTACEAFCETATGNTCKCQCGGMNHGVRA